VPVGDEVGPPPTLEKPALHEPSAPRANWPLLPQKPAGDAPHPATPAGETEQPAPGTATPPALQVPPAPPVPLHTPHLDVPENPPENVPMSPSVIMSRPTTLRASIEKVTIESLISPAFRASSEEGPPVAKLPATPAAPPPLTPSTATPPVLAQAPPAPATPTPPAFAAATPGAANAPESPTAAKPETPAPATPTPSADLPPAPAPPVRPQVSLVPPVFDDPEFNLDPAPESSSREPATNPASDSESDERSVKRMPESGAKILPLPIAAQRAAPPEQDGEGELDDSKASRVDPEAFARATVDFMRSSPVLGATARPVPRGADETGFFEPDAIALASMVQDLTRMGVPAERQPELRARLNDLARRLERDELEWSTLRKSVWFVMEYPELARRVVPILLPWIDRAA